MTVPDIFGQISNRMIEGLITHSQLADYFGFLGFEGYQECHLYHFQEENNNYKKIAKYYLKHYNKILVEKPFKNPNVIPEDQQQFTREQVSNDIKKNGLQVGFDKQVTQEKETKKFYENHYQNLINNNEVAAAYELATYITDVDFELAEAEQEQLKLGGMDYSVLDILLEQDKKKKEYCKKIKEIELC